ncbi:MAG: 4-hydroxy-3-methylbut-2-enyl diphosphate reductase [Atopobiaceae bacterium]|nr:4-hydroxy-3-methylbut-2-enyl diphosphate reductase [Atopobiaceae bacterium]
MARVEVAREAGACFGVERALAMVRGLAKGGDALQTLGPLIHNPSVVQELSDAGVGVIDEPEQATAGSTLVLRTHGVTPEVEERARNAGLVVADATCPFVKKVHKAAERLAAEGYQVLVVGEAGHPEVEGTLGHAAGAQVVGTASDVDALQVGRRVGLVVQTTLAERVLREVVAALVGRCDELRVFDTICDATSKRQEAAAELADHAGVMVVVGGKNSANTTHLYDICAERCARTHHIESADELDAGWFVDAELIGITAGASTPADHIERVRAGIERLVTA